MTLVKLSDSLRNDHTTSTVKYWRISQNNVSNVSMRGSLAVAAASVVKQASTDVLLCGGGVIGWSSAYFLATSGRVDPTKITVVERDPSLQHSSSALSASGIRTQFSNRQNIKASLFSAQFFRDAKDNLTTDPALPVDLGFQEIGYLFLARTEDGVATLRSNHLVQQAAGAVVSLLQPDEVKDRYPWMNVSDLRLAAFGTKNEGRVDSILLTQALRDKARSLGVQYIKDEVVGLDLGKDGSAVKSVRLANQNAISVFEFVNCAGPWASEIAAMANCTVPVEPRKRCIFVFKCPKELGNVPMIVDSTGVYVRPEGSHYITGVGPPADRDPAAFDWEVDHDLFEDIIWPALAHRIPAFEEIKVTSSWAGLYEYNTEDQNAIVGRHPTVNNFLFANGFSGHGLQQSPAIGRAVSELLTHGHFKTLDLSPFKYERFASGDLVLEKCVV